LELWDLVLDSSAFSLEYINILWSLLIFIVRSNTCRVVMIANFSSPAWDQISSRTLHSFLGGDSSWLTECRWIYLCARLKIDAFQCYQRNKSTLCTYKQSRREEVAWGCTYRFQVPSTPSTFCSKSQVKMVDIHFCTSPSVIAT
jgi:hypothetical protein